MRSRAIDVALAAAVAIVPLVLYRKIIRLFWTFDDAYLIHIAAVHSAKEHFVGSAIWRSMPQRLFTPLLTATFDAELTTFGDIARRFYTVQLVLVALLAIAIFAACRDYLPRAAAVSAAVVFIAGPPLCVVASELMLVHYIESLILCAIAFILFRRSTWLSAIAYLAAMLAKEIAVPLVAVFVLIEPRRWRRWLPHVMVLAVYALWRRAALGEWIGGYGWTIRPAEWATVIPSSWRAIVSFLGWPLLIVLAIGMVLRIRSRRDAIAIAVILILAIAPVLPMAKKFEPRFTLALWLALSVIAIAGFATIRDVRLRIAILIAVPIFAILVNRQVWAAEYRRALHMSNDARRYFDLGPGDVMRKPAIPPASMIEMRWLKEDFDHRARGTTWFYDDLYLCGTPVPQFEPVRKRYCASIRDRAPLSATFRHDGESLYWTFGPYDRGAYGVVMANGVQAYDVPRSDGFRLPGVRALALRIRYEAPEGWVTYSPDIHLDLSRDTTVTWRR